MSYNEIELKHGKVGDEAGIWKEVLTECLFCKSAIEIEVDVSINGGVLPEHIQCDQCKRYLRAAYTMDVNLVVEKLPPEEEPNDDGQVINLLNT